LAWFCPHKSKNGRTDGFSPARTESWLARNDKVSARIEFSPHGRENGRTNRIFGARKGNLSAQMGLVAAGDDFCTHGSRGHPRATKNLSKINHFGCGTSRHCRRAVANLSAEFLLDRSPLSQHSPGKMPG
jgi:hypothetical protein